jgi:hypothetical protein
MNSIFKISAFCLLLSINMYAGKAKPDSTGMPGDNLDLAAVLSIFKDSKTPEDFEKKLNSADTKVNNLDLNHDGKVDYLSVKDYGKNDLHSLVIQDAVNQSENQDVAVIEVEKKGDQDAHVQIVGDESLYGKNYIVEPEQKTEVKYQSDYADDVYATTPASPTVFVNVWGWPCVSYMYGPSYVFWASPWYWGFYPSWWYPWSPYGLYYYHQNVVGFYDYRYGNYYYGWRRSTVNNAPRAHNMYMPHRTASQYVQKNNPIVTPRQTRMGRPVNGVPGSRNYPNQSAPRSNGNMNQPVRQTPSMRYGPTRTGGVRGGGAAGGMHGGFGGGGMRRK